MAITSAAIIALLCVTLFGYRVQSAPVGDNPETVTIAHKHEATKKAAEYRFKCFSTSIIELELEKVCNDADDCPDGSDETEETCLLIRKMCPAGLVKCPGYHFCIEQKSICDGIKDCENGWDESEGAGCPMRHMWRDNNTLCQAGYSACDAPFNRCIPDDAKCDFKRDCEGGEDEIDCPDVRMCPPNLYRCYRSGDNEQRFYRNCIQNELVCNNVADCPNGEDETVDACHLHHQQFHSKKSAPKNSSGRVDVPGLVSVNGCFLLGFLIHQAVW